MDEITKVKYDKLPAEFDSITVETTDLKDGRGHVVTYVSVDVDGDVKVSSNQKVFENRVGNYRLQIHTHKKE